MISVRKRNSEENCDGHRDDVGEAGAGIGRCMTPRTDRIALLAGLMAVPDAPVRNKPIPFIHGYTGGNSDFTTMCRALPLAGSFSSSRRLVLSGYDAVAARRRASTNSFLPMIAEKQDPMK